MTTEERLDLIIAKCREMIDISRKEPCSVMESAVSAYKATIAACSLLRTMADFRWEINELQATHDILESFPINLLISHDIH
jgi:hypothetical protein